MGRPCLYPWVVVLQQAAGQIREALLDDAVAGVHSQGYSLQHAEAPQNQGKAASR